MAPAPVAGLGLDVDVVIIRVALAALVVETEVDVAPPGEILHQRLGLHDLFDLRQLDGLRRLAIGQRDLARLSRQQRLGTLAIYRTELDQQLVITFQGGDFLPVQRDGAAVVGFQQQLAAVEEANGAGETVTVLQPDGIGEGGGTAQSDAQA